MTEHNRDKHELICYILQYELSSMTRDDLENFVFDRMYDDLIDQDLEEILKTYRCYYEE